MKEIKIQNVDEIIYHEECENGLQIYLWPNPKVRSFYATLNVRYGSNDIEYKIKGKKNIIKTPTGIAHFLEHQNFTESDGSSVFEYFSRLGSSINAFTTYDYTAYEVSGSNHFKENITHLLDYVSSPYFTKATIKKEKGIIIEEIKMCNDRPGTQIYHALNKCLFKKDPTKIPIIGTIEDVKNTTLEDIKNVYETFYHPQNMFLVITGNFNVQETLAIIKENQAQKQWTEYTFPERKKYKEPISVACHFQELYQNIKIPKLTLAYKLDRKIFAEYKRQELFPYLMIILRKNFGGSSLLREELIKNELITGGLHFDLEIEDDYIIIVFQTETDYPNEIVKTLREKMNNLEIDESTIRRRKKVNIASNALKYDDIDQINQKIQNAIIKYKEISTNDYEIFSKLNIETANKIVGKLKPTNEVIIIAYPLDQKNAKKEN